MISEAVQAESLVRDVGRRNRKRLNTGYGMDATTLFAPLANVEIMVSLVVIQVMVCPDCHAEGIAGRRVS